MNSCEFVKMSFATALPSPHPIHRIDETAMQSHAVIDHVASQASTREVLKYLAVKCSQAELLGISPEAKGLIFGIIIGTRELTGIGGSSDEGRGEIPVS